MFHIRFDLVVISMTTYWFDFSALWWGRQWSGSDFVLWWRGDGAGKQLLFHLKCWINWVGSSDSIGFPHSLIRHSFPSVVSSQLVCHELIPGGKTMCVTNENKWVHFVSSVKCKYNFRDSAASYSHSFQQEEMTRWKNELALEAERFKKQLGICNHRQILNLSI